jgi:hypothetical protein
LARFHAGPLSIGCEVDQPQEIACPYARREDTDGYRALGAQTRLCTTWTKRLSRHKRKSPQTQVFEKRRLASPGSAQNDHRTVLGRLPIFPGDREGGSPIHHVEGFLIVLSAEGRLHAHRNVDCLDLGSVHRFARRRADERDELDLLAQSIRIRPVLGWETRRAGPERRRKRGIFARGRSCDSGRRIGRWNSERQDAEDYGLDERRGYLPSFYASLQLSPRSSSAWSG